MKNFVICLFVFAMCSITNVLAESNNDNQCSYVGKNGKRCNHWCRKNEKYCDYHYWGYAAHRNDSIKAINDSIKFVRRSEEQRIKYEMYSHVNALAISGAELKKSATYEAIAWGTFIGGTTLGVVGATSNDNSGVRTMCLVGAGALGITSLVCEIMHISHKYKSGQILEYSGSRVTYKF